jgi:hypothetical protein
MVKPMKGAHLIANEATINFVYEALYAIRSVMDDEATDFDSGHSIKLLATYEGWTTEQDKFGTKVYTSMPYPVNQHDVGELRVGLVLRKDDTLYVDIRPWGEY